MSAGMIPPGISLSSRIIGAMVTLIVGLLLVLLLLWLAADPGDHRHPSGQEQNKQMMPEPEKWRGTEKSLPKEQPTEEQVPLYPPSLPGLLPHVKF